MLYLKARDAASKAYRGQEEAFKAGADWSMINAPEMLELQAVLYKIASKTWVDPETETYNVYDRNHQSKKLARGALKQFEILKLMLLGIKAKDGDHPLGVGFFDEQY